MPNLQSRLEEQHIDGQALECPLKPNSHPDQAFDRVYSAGSGEAR